MIFACFFWSNNPKASTCHTKGFPVGLSQNANIFAKKKKKNHLHHHVITCIGKEVALGSAIKDLEEFFHLVPLTYFSNFLISCSHANMPCFSSSSLCFLHGPHFYLCLIMHLDLPPFHSPFSGWLTFYQNACLHATESRFNPSRMN